MNKQELTSHIANQSDISTKSAKRALESTLIAITDTLVSGDDVSLIGFGTFTVKKRAARSGRNPQTGETLQIPEAIIPTFKPGKSLKDSVNT